MLASYTRGDCDWVEGSSPFNVNFFLSLNSLNSVKVLFSQVSACHSVHGGRGSPCDHYP